MSPPSIFVGDAFTDGITDRDGQFLRLVMNYRLFIGLGVKSLWCFSQTNRGFSLSILRVWAVGDGAIFFRFRGLGGTTLLLGIFFRVCLASFFRVTLAYVKFFFAYFTRYAHEDA